MIVTFMQGNGVLKTFEQVQSIIHHSPLMIELKFKTPHQYPANEVYIGFDNPDYKLTVQVKD